MISSSTELLLSLLLLLFSVIFYFESLFSLELITIYSWINLVHFVLERLKIGTTSLTYYAASFLYNSFVFNSFSSLAKEFCHNADSLEVNPLSTPNF